MEKSKIYDKIYDVISVDNYIQDKDKIDPAYTAVRDNDYLYPIRNKNSNLPGLYNQYSGIIYFKNPETEEDKKEYSVSNTIDFNNAKSLREVIEKQNKLKSAERTILTTPDKIYVPMIGENNSPEMAGLKEAVIAKHIDIEKYQPRFGSNYSNDIRLFNGDNISLAKLKTMLRCLDMKGTLIIEDASDDVPNPIGRQIYIDLLGGDNNESV